MGRRVWLLLTLSSSFACTEITRTEYEPTPLPPYKFEGTGGSGAGGNPSSTGGAPVEPSLPKDFTSITSIGIDPSIGGSIRALESGPTGLLPDPEGGVVLAGYESPANVQGVGVMRLLPGGATGWSHWLGIDNEDGATLVTFGGAVIDADGNTYVAGSFVGALSIGGVTLESDAPSTADDAYDIFLLKLDLQGNVLFFQSFGGAGEQMAIELAISPAGTLLMLGTFATSVDLGGVELSNSGGSVRDLFIARFDTAGAVLHARAFEAPLLPIIDAEVDSGDNLLLAGSNYLAPGGELGGLALPSPYWIMKLDASFEPIWASGLGSEPIPGPQDIAVDHADNVVVACGGYGFVSAGQVLSSGIALVKFDPGGNRLFLKPYGNNASDRLNSIAILSDNGIALTGGFHDTVDFGGGSLFSLEPYQESPDVFVARLDENGEHVWTVQTGGVGYDIGASIVALPSGRLVTSGSFSNAIMFGNETVAFQGGPYVAWITP